MSNSLQMLGQVTRGGSLQLSREKAPADSPTAAIEQPNLSFPGHHIRAGRDAGWILKNVKATKIKVDDKTSLSNAGIDSDGFMDFRGVEVDDINLDWDKIIPADKLAEIKAEEEKKQHKAYITKAAAEGAPRRAAIRSRNREREPNSRLTKTHKEQRDGEYHTPVFFRDAKPRLTSSPEAVHDYPSPGPYGSLPPHRSADTLLDCRLLSTHYTISQDHTSGQEAHKDSLLANFGKRRRTNKPSIPLGGSTLLQRSPSLLPSLANGNDVVAQNGGSGMQKVSQDDLDFLNNWKPIGSEMPEDAVSFPQETATTESNEEKDRGDEVEFGWLQGRSRRFQSRALQRYSRRQDRGTYLADKNGDRPPASLKRRCHSCNRTDSREWRSGPDGARALCNACGLHYAKLQRKRTWV